MLSIGAMANGQGTYYQNIAREDYYLNGGEPPGRWLGTGARALGLTGMVGPDQLSRLLAGYSATREPLIQNAGSRNHQPGWDLTFSAPKSVSVLWSQGDAPLRRAIEEAHRGAVARAIQYMEETCAFSRRGKGGHIHQRALLTVAAFEHGTSRAQEPQLHTHCLVMNVAVRPDGTTGTLLSLPLYQHKMVSGALYRTELSAQLRQHLGIACKRVGQFFEIEGVPDALMRAFSSRRESIEKELATRGLSSASAAASAALSTRDSKGAVLSRHQLFERWREIGKPHPIRTQPAVTLDLGKELDRAWGDAIQRIDARVSHFTRPEILRGVAEECQARGIGADDVRKDLDRRLVTCPDVVRISDERYATAATLKMERTLIDVATDLGRQARHGVKPVTVERIIARYSTPRSPIVEELKHHGRQILSAAQGRPTTPIDRAAIAAQAAPVLSPEQAAAVRHLTLKGGGSIRIVEGRAGTGKSFLLGVARQAWEAAGYRVIGTALSGKAARELTNASGIEAVPLRLLEVRLHPDWRYQVKHHLRQIARAAVQRTTYPLRPLRIDRKTVLVVDEAGMLGTRQMMALLSDVRKRGGMVVLVGDRGQLQPIEAGAPFASIADRAGRAEVSKVVRQSDPQDIAAINSIRQGKARRGLENLEGRGRLHIAKDRARAIEQMVRDWGEIPTQERDRALIFVGLRREVVEVNRQCQAERVRRGELSAGASLPLRDGPVYVGDRVICKKRAPRLGLENGDLGTVTALDVGGNRLTLRLDSGRSVPLPLANGPDLRLGYAVTTHSGQGTTVDQALVLAGSRIQDRELTYVQVSRARHSVQLYTDEHEAGKNLKDLVKQVARSNAKSLATDVHSPLPQHPMGPEI